MSIYKRLRSFERELDGRGEPARALYFRLIQGTVCLTCPVFPRLLAALILAGCATQGPVSQKEVEKEKRAGESTTAGCGERCAPENSPASVKDREGWAQDLATTFSSQQLAPTLENICSVLAVAQQESNYQSDPVVPGLQ